MRTVTDGHQLYPPERISIAHGAFVLILEGEHHATEHTVGSCEYRHDIPARFWRGIGKLINSEAQRERAFRFETDSWGDREPLWIRNLARSVVCFTDENGHERFEPFDPDDFPLVFQEIIGTVGAAIASTPVDQIATIKFKPLRFEEMIRKGVRFIYMGKGCGRLVDPEEVRYLLPV